MSVALIQQRDQLRQAWIDLLSPFDWQVFATFTFAESIHPEAADKKFRRFDAFLNRAIFGRTWYKHADRRVFYVRALELQKRGVIHFHALFALQRWQAAGAFSHLWNDFPGLWREANTEWLKLAGFSWFECVERLSAVNRYVTKYVVKGGEIDFSPNANRYLPEQSAEIVQR